MHGIGHLLGEPGIVAMDGDRRGQAQGHFLGEGRAGDHRQRHVRAQHLARDLVQETAGTGLEALGRPGHAGTGGQQRRQRAHGFAEGVRRHHHQDPAGTGDGTGQVSAGTQGIRQRNPRQVPGILVTTVDRLDHVRVASPQHGRVTMPCQQAGQRGAPGARAEDGDLFRVVGTHPQGWAPVRRCRPARSRPATRRRPAAGAGAGFRRTGLRS